MQIYQPCQMLNCKRKLDYQTRYVFEIITLAFASDQEQQGIPVSQQKGGSWTLNRIPDNNIKCKLGEEFRLWAASNCSTFQMIFPKFFCSTCSVTMG